MGRMSQLRREDLDAVYKVVHKEKSSKQMTIIHIYFNIDLPA